MIKKINKEQLKEKRQQALEWVLFFLDNNRPAFLQALAKNLPAIQLASFWLEKDRLDNDELSEFILEWLTKNVSLKDLKGIKIPYNENVHNYTTDEANKNIIYKLAGVPYEPDNIEKSSAGVVNLDLGGVFEGLDELFGTTTNVTSTTITTTTKGNAMLLIGVALVIGIVSIFLIKKLM